MRGPKSVHGVRLKVGRGSGQADITTNSLAACVDSAGKVYCYFPRDLSPWVITTGLYKKCYDEIVDCPRCAAQHKRGHIGRDGICGRPFRDQESQTDF